MSDFLISLNKEYRGKDLLNLIKKPYGGRAPEGRFFDYSWGGVAVLEERLASNRNCITDGTTTFAWVGDLVTNSTDSFIELFMNRLTFLQGHDENASVSLQTDELFEKLNGAFAILLTNPTGFCIVTDPMGFTMVYVGKNKRNEAFSFGTHPDLVAGVIDRPLRVDIVSVGEFLSTGIRTFPNTVYENVKELNPGALYTAKVKGGKAEIKDYVYWVPPKEIRQGCDENEMAEELRDALISAVRDRCDKGRVAVTLSGGEDSRLVLAAVPDTVECICLTFCDQLNRETRIASKAARCYNREWHALIRDKEFLGNSIVDIVKTMGCEFEWVNAHAVGFVDQIAEYGVDYLLGGFFFDTYFKGYFARDFVRVKHMAGIMPSRYEKREFDYAHSMGSSHGDPAFWKRNLRKDIIDRIYNRRKSRYDRILDDRRSSIESLMFYPFSNDIHGACWAAERRVLPIRLVAMDRHLVDLAFKFPVEFKLSRKIFIKAAKNIYGAGARIPSANDGVRPGSGHWSRLAQRAIRKLQDRTTHLLEKLGKEPKVQHSWSDYQKYWRESNKLTRLIREYGPNLGQFDGILFRDSGRELLECKDIHWRNGFRLLQLAIWRGIINDYGLK